LEAGDGVCRCLKSERGWGHMALYTIIRVYEALN